jgi:hypothetical protein
VGQKAIDGNHVLYHYMEKELRDRDIWLFQMLAARLLTSLAIWFNPATYVLCPILLPFVVRDPTCRKRKTTDVEAWGSPNAAGYFRDDNTLIKALPRQLRVDCEANSLYHGRTIGNGFVAAHVWRVIESKAAKLSSRDALTNSFIPNLVWLPTQVAKLTDREGSFAQLYLQALSAKIYRNVEVVAPLKKIADDAWNRLPMPLGVPENGLPNLDEIAFFEHSTKFARRRLETVAHVVSAVKAIQQGEPLKKKLISGRYTTGLPEVGPQELHPLIEALDPFVEQLSALAM